MKDKRSRVAYAIAIVAVVISGLLSRSSLAEYMPSFIATYAGDTLWALMVFLGFGFLFPGMGTLVVAGVALAVSFGVEFSQLYQADWINGVRDTRMGALVLGAGFLGSDFVCYTTGVAMGVVGELVASCRKAR
jgi:hypothetical protein